MTRLRLRTVALLALTLLALSPALGSVTDAATDFSGNNPSGVWTYGWLPAGAINTGGFQAFDTFRLDSLVGATAPGINSWTREDDTIPTVAGNSTFDVIFLPTVVLAPYELLLHPGAGGEYADVRWTAPESTNYIVTSFFEAIDFGDLTSDGTTTDVHVAINGTLVLDDLINGYGGASVAYAPYAPQWFNAGDTVDFIVGANGSYLNDSTGLQASFDSVPEPGTLALLGIGLLGLGALRRRPR